MANKDKKDDDMVAAGGMNAKGGRLKQGMKDKRQGDADIIAAGGGNRSSAPSSDNVLPTGAGNAKKGGKR